MQGKLRAVLREQHSRGGRRDPLIIEYQEKRRAFCIYARKLLEDRVITSEQEAEIIRRYDSKAPASHPPTPRPDTLPVLLEWAQFGRPGQISGGGMSVPIVMDNRAALYQPRLAWLNEQGIMSGERQLYLEGWRVLDETFLDILGEMVTEASER